MEGTDQRYGLERDAYVVLLHLYTFSQLGAVAALARDRIMRDLGMREARVDELLRRLVLEEFIVYSTTGEGLIPTEKGSEYIETGAARRRSLRLTA